jgi:ribose transport system substrate-binding protein
MISLPEVSARRARPALLAAAATAAALLVTGCGDDNAAKSGSASTGAQASGVEEAKKLVAELEKPLQFVAPGETIEVGDQLRGKTIYVVANGLNFPFVQAMLDGLKAGAKKVGAKVIAVDGAGDNAKAANLVEQGIGRKVDLIVIQSFPAEQLTASLKAAKDADIPVLEMFGRDPQLPSAELQAAGVDAIASFCYSCAGKQMAQLAVADTGGDVNAVLFDVPEIGVSALEKKGFQDELKRLCSGCEVEVVEAPLAQWNQNLASLTSSSLQRNPNVNYLVPLYDSMIALMEPAVAAAGASDKVKVVSYNATQPALKLLADGKLVAGDVGGMNAWAGWAAMDQIARILTGNEPVEDPKIPNRLFTAANVGELDLEAGETSWYGDVDLDAEYGALWGL